MTDALREKVARAFAEARLWPGAWDRMGEAERDTFLQGAEGVLALPELAHPADTAPRSPETGLTGRALFDMFQREIPPNGWTEPLTWSDYGKESQAVFDRVAAALRASEPRPEPAVIVEEDPSHGGIVNVHFGSSMVAVWADKVSIVEGGKCRWLDREYPHTPAKPAGEERMRALRDALDVEWATQNARALTATGREDDHAR